MSDRKLTELFDQSSKLVDLLGQQADRRNYSRQKKLIDLSGQRFGRWLVLGLHPKRMPDRHTQNMNQRPRSKTKTKRKALRVKIKDRRKFAASLARAAGRNGGAP